MNYSVYSSFRGLRSLRDRQGHFDGQQRPGSQSKRWRLRLRHLMAALAASTVLGAFPAARAFEVFFNAPHVLGGIRGVKITLPSTGATSFYDVILKKGTLSEIFGTPPVTDVDNADDAQALMEKSAAGINAYLTANLGEPLYFAETGETGYYIPYGSPYTNTSGLKYIGVSISIPHCLVGFYWDPVENVCRIDPNFGLRQAPQITPVLGEVYTQQSVAWVDVQPIVPTPLPLAGGVAAWRWARKLRRASKLMG